MAPRRGGSSSSSGSSRNRCAETGVFDEPLIVGGISINAIVLVLLLVLLFLSFRTKLRNDGARRVLGLWMTLALLFYFLSVALDTLFVVLVGCDVMTYTVYNYAFIAVLVLAYAAELIIIAIILLPLLTTLRSRSGQESRAVDMVRRSFVGILSIILLAAVVIDCYLIGSSSTGANLYQESEGLFTTYLVLFCLCAGVAGFFIISALTRMKKLGTASKPLGFWLVFLVTSLLIVSLYRLISFVVRIVAAVPITGGASLAVSGVRALIEVVTIFALIKAAGSITGRDGSATAAYQPDFATTMQSQVPASPTPTALPAFTQVNPANGQPRQGYPGAYRYQPVPAEGQMQQVQLTGQQQSSIGTAYYR